MVSAPTQLQKGSGTTEGFQRPLKAFFNTGVTGFEPVFTVLETVALPLNYTPLSQIDH
jgi:hypothetical protein